MGKTHSTKKSRSKHSGAEPEESHFIEKEQFSENTSSAWIKDIKIDCRFNLSKKHKEVLQRMKADTTKIMIVDGPAGTAKTFVATFAALALLQEQKIEKIYYVRSAVESADKSLGFLPGEMADKFAPYLVPIQEKMVELLRGSDVNKLVTNKVVEGSPINFWRGRTAKDSVVIVDEAQSMTASELKTILTRVGDNTRIIFLGDSMQSDIGHKTGFPWLMRLFGEKNDHEAAEHGVYRFTFGEDEIVRSKILKFIIKRIEAHA